MNLMKTEAEKLTERIMSRVTHLFNMGEMTDGCVTEIKQMLEVDCSTYNDFLEVVQHNNLGLSLENHITQNTQSSPLTCGSPWPKILNQSQRLNNMKHQTVYIVVAIQSGNRPNVFTFHSESIARDLFNSLCKEFGAPQDHDAYSFVNGHDSVDFYQEEIK